MRDVLPSYFAVTVSCCDRGAIRGILAPSERYAIAPHAVEDHGELASDRDAGAGHAAMLGDLDPPGPQARPLFAAHQLV